MFILTVYPENSYMNYNSLSVDTHGLYTYIIMSPVIKDSYIFLSNSYISYISFSFHIASTSRTSKIIFD